MSNRSTTQPHGADAGHFEANRRNWDERSHIHAAAAGYEVDRFHDDPNHVSGVVDFDRTYLGDIDGLRVAHLQCHIGTDTLSLARLGARVTGLDQSGDSLGHARALFAANGTATCANIGALSGRCGRTWSSTTASGSCHPPSATSCR